MSFNIVSDLLANTIKYNNNNSDADGEVKVLGF